MGRTDKYDDRESEKRRRKRSRSHENRKKSSSKHKRSRSNSPSSTSTSDDNRSVTPVKRSSHVHRSEQRHKESTDRKSHRSNRSPKSTKKDSSDREHTSKSEKDAKNKSNDKSKKLEVKTSIPETESSNLIDDLKNNQNVDSSSENETSKKRGRVQAWRERMLTLNNNSFESSKVQLTSIPEPMSESSSQPVKIISSDEPQKTWTLDDDKDDEEIQDSPQGIHSKLMRVEIEDSVSDHKAMEVENEIDPLDEYMEKLTKENLEVLLISKQDMNSSSIEDKGMLIEEDETPFKKSQKNNLNTQKAEIIEQNQDLMEYSSEESDTDLDSLLAFAKHVKPKKNLHTVDHSKITYIPVKKQFYIEVPEITKMTSEEVAEYRLLLEGIQVRGKNCPKPVKNWSQTGVSLKVLDILKKNNFEKPTPIQAQAIPAILSGRDLIGIAKTGSGKTLAFLIPMFRHVLDQPPLEEGDGPISIIITPTRELALQIYRDCRKFTKQLSLTVVCLFGGSGISDQIAELKRGTDIVVCTPGRMIDMLAANNGKVTNCRRCTFLVIDEADRMFDLGFEPQITKIIEQIRPDRQTIMFSATFPRQMEALARKILKKPIEIQVGGRSVVCSDIDQYVIVIEEDNKFFKLLELLGIYYEFGSVLVFVEKQESSEFLLRDLLKKGYACLSLHGGMDQFDRDSTISDFKNGVTSIMVATSVAARGLDVKNLILVVNYDCPNHYEDYVHRCGRTGRAGSKGTAYTFVTPDEGKLAADIIMALQLSKKDVPIELQDLWCSYSAKMKADGKHISKNTGFGGKGFKFDDGELAMKKELQKLIKRNMNMQDSEDEAEEEETTLTKIESDIEKAFSNKGPQKADSFSPAMLAIVDKDKIQAAKSALSELNEKIQTAASSSTTSSNLSAYGEPMSSTQQAAASILRGENVGEVSMSAAGLARQLAEKLNEKLNYSGISSLPTGITVEQKLMAEQMEIFLEEVDINDFPQQARWKITSRETLSSICELVDVFITVRGQYINPSMRKAQTTPTEFMNPNDRSLHLVIEANKAMKIQMAKAEIKRILKEELLKMDPSVFRSSFGGRYRVI